MPQQVNITYAQTRNPVYTELKSKIKHVIHTKQTFQHLDISNTQLLTFNQQRQLGLF